MSITVGSNISSLVAQRHLGKSSEALSKSSERLASGMRINRASDDAAGLAIATSLNSDTRVFGQAIRNVNDGISLLSIADSALGELSNIVIRMRELAESAANGTYSTKQRQTMTKEARALRDEWNRIIESTSFNGVKLLDLSNDTLSIQAGSGANTVLSINLGHELARDVGDGTFQAGVSYATNTLNPENLASYDLNGDGFLDIVTSNQSSINVSFGNGNGTLKAGISYASSSATSVNSTLGMKIYDFNNDGKMDIATVSDGDDSLDILFGNGDGSFKSPISYVSGADPAAMSSGDFNGDGILDLVVTTLGSATMNIYLGNSNGSFKARISYTANSFANDVQVGDINNDGILDVAVSAGLGPSIDIFMGRGDGTFLAGVSYAGGAGSRGISLTDVNGDDMLDLIVPALSDTAINVLINNGNGTFTAKRTIASGLSSIMVKTADINDDGFMDIISNGGSSISVFLSNGNGTFKAPSSALSGARQFIVSDFNRDGISDIAVADEAGDKIWMHIGNSAEVTTLGKPTLDTQEDARALMTVLDNTLNRIALERGNIGSMQSRFDIAVQNLSSLRVNYQSAESRIRDIDVAEETAQFTRVGILQQIGASVLSQANQIPSLAIKLLRG